MRQFVTTCFAILMFQLVCRAGAIERLRQGFGATLSASTTPQQCVFRQIATTDVVSNGTFDADNAWTTNTGWSIAGGALVWTTDDPLTNTAYQACAALRDRETYRIRFTVAGIDPTTNTITVILGASTGTVRTADGTYTEDIPMYGTSSNITFRATATNAGETAAFTVDNVIVRKLSDIGYAGEIQLNVLPTDVPVYFLLNGSAEAMTNCYAESQCMVVTSNAVFTVEDNGYRRITEVWYRTGSGTATATLNAN
jgi:hypothetical protein